MNAKSFGPVKLLHIGDIGSESLSLVHTTSFGSLRSCRKQGRKLTGGGQFGEWAPKWKKSKRKLLALVQEKLSGFSTE